ncbi:MAG: ActS/PrrB/RegB family redox-sensitive histidine kinase [Alphaproteobacteria bacterium]|nr:ActS/PrrB/RegB family redox-sensitive histidine kinase [Alphaproteobacteria bacterium]
MTTADGTELPRAGLAGQYGAPRAEVQPSRTRAGRVSLRTLTAIRWIAIAGQLAALVVVRYGLGWDLPIAPALAVVAASVLLNLALAFRHPPRGRLGDAEAAAYLGFDVLQLAALLYLTGGLTNPFALLVLGPVAVSATVLSRRATAALCALVIACASGLAVRYLPLPWADGPGPSLPGLYVAGTWAAVVIGTVFLAAYAASVANQGRQMQDALAATQLALAREQRVSALGALAAAAAHELGSPLSTIAVITKELQREVPADHPIAEDLRMLQTECDRCRDILAELGRRPDAAEGGEPWQEMPLSAMIEAAAMPHRNERVRLTVEKAATDGSAEPVVRRSPELLHGVGNILQNAMQFASRDVWVALAWDAGNVRVTVRDDGRGFAPAVLDVIGEPYISSRGGEHLGLGIFIAQTLLGETGGRLSCRNARATDGRSAGAEVDIVWRRVTLDTVAGQQETRS